MLARYRLLLVAQFVGQGPTESANEVTVWGYRPSRVVRCTDVRQIPEALALLR